MELEKVKAEEAKELLTLLEGNPLVQRIKAEKEAEILEKRREAEAKLLSLQAEAEALPTAEEAMADLKLELSRKEEEVKKIREEISRRVFENRGRRLELEREMRQAEGILLETYDKRIDETINLFMEKLDWLRRPERISSDNARGETNLFTEKKTITVRSNVNRIKGAMQYTQSAIKELEKMKLLPEVDLEKIERLKGGIPRIDEYDEFAGEKPLPKGPSGIIYRTAYEDELTARLIKKVDKYLATPKK